MANKYIKKAKLWASRTAVSLISEDSAFQLFADVAKRLGIRTISAEGALGSITGFPGDMVIGGYIRNKDYQPNLRRLIDNCLGPDGGMFLDIGANIGLTAISVARRIDVVCHLFEAEPENFRLLETNLRANAPADRVRFHNLALFKEKGTVTFELSDDNRGDHRVRQDSLISNEKFGETARRTVTVEAAPLDDLVDVKDMAGRLVLKVDTQGGEVNVFRGASQVLGRADYVISEFCPYMLLRAGTAVEDFIAVMKGFPFAAILPEGREDEIILTDVNQVVSELAERVPFDGSAARHLDLIFARHRAI